MQSIKIVVRQVGTPNTQLDVLSPAEISDYLEFGYGSKGYDLQASHYLGAVKDASGNTVGWQVMFVLVKNVEANDVAEAPVKKVKVNA